MSATLRLVHSTGYTYNGHASASYNEARLAPLATADQTVLHHRLEITPSPWSQVWTDYWGTQVTTFEVHEPHDELQVTAVSTVVVDRKTPTGEGLPLSEMRSVRVRDEFDELLGVSELVEPGDALRSVAADLAGRCGTAADLVDAVLARLRERVVVVPGRKARAASRDAWDAGEGTSADLAHLMIGTLRAQGIPARYVSGYVLGDGDAPLGETTPGEARAWVQWWDGAWLGVDPAQGVVPGDFYIEVGRGRDYADVVPLRGIFTGSPGSDMFVTVEMSRLA